MMNPKAIIVASTPASTIAPRKTPLPRTRPAWFWFCMVPARKARSPG
jgi:hypothetical protein